MGKVLLRINDEQFVKRGVAMRITNKQAALIYFLMRGGIGSAYVLSRLIGCKTEFLSGLNLDDVFVFIDNAEIVGKARLPAAKGRIECYCQQCGFKLIEIPCPCGRKPHYDTLPPKLFGIAKEGKYNDGTNGRSRALTHAERHDIQYHGNGYIERL